ncbi:MAG TPA: hypothetical protein VLC09_14755 [Polyangiaceae bacterium]|nr:hypothetical protein [Polyangiaceae bacterium]
MNESSVNGDATSGAATSGSAASAAAPVEERGGSLSFRVIWVGLALSVIGALCVAYYIYLRYVRFEPSAAHHVTEGAELVARIDVQQAVVYQPFRKHLLHLLEAGRTGPESRLLHVERKTTLELGVDTREVVLGVGEGNLWSIALGGLFRPDGVVTGVGRMLDDEKIEHRLLAEPERLEVGPVGAERGVFGLADDGTLILAGSGSSFRSARVPGPAPRLAAAPGEFLVLDLRRPQGFQLRSGGRLLSLHGVVKAGNAFAYRFEAQWEGGGESLPWPEVAPQWLSLGFVVGGKSEQPGPGRVVVQGELSRPEFEQMLARLAMAVRSAARLPI